MVFMGVRPFVCNCEVTLGCDILPQAIASRGIDVLPIAGHVPMAVKSLLEVDSLLNFVS